jgi:hypothetical protein
MLRKENFMTEEKEIWKVYPEFPFIEASNLGRIRAKDRIVTDRNGRKQLIKGRILKQRLRPDGYMDIQFQANGKHISLKVHRVVATCFIPNPDNLPEVNYIDNDRTNNSVDNLEWCTRKYNQIYKKKFGTSPADIQGRSVVAVNPKTGEILWFESQHEAARQLGANQGNIFRVINGQRKTIKGFWFTYADENAVEKAKNKFSDEVAKKVEKLIYQNKKL